MFDTITRLRPIITRTSIKPMSCAALLLLVSACTQRSDPTFTNETEFGILEITTLTAGVNVDPDGYTLVIDESRTQSVGTNETVQFSLVVDRYSVQLNDVADNCSVSPNPLVIQVLAGITTDGLFEITCS